MPNQRTWAKSPIEEADSHGQVVGNMDACKL